MQWYNYEFSYYISTQHEWSQLLQFYDKCWMDDYNMEKIQWNSDNKDFHNNFECHAWITVSQSYTVEELLKDTLHKLCKEKLETPLHNDSLIDEMRNHLRHKRYVVLFHDVWDKKFSDGIDFAIIDKNSDIGINHYFGHRLRSFVR